MKYKYNLILKNLFIILKYIFTKTNFKYNITLLEWNHDYDHVHALMTGTPGTRMDVFLGTYKSRSAGRHGRCSRKPGNPCGRVVFGTGAAAWHQPRGAAGDLETLYREPEASRWRTGRPCPACTRAGSGRI
ncbi:MAG: transposase [Deltaproteobacteria bacterium]|nr:transposase [Deltaproteobacteria bacterium]